MSFKRKIMMKFQVLKCTISQINVIIDSNNVISKKIYTTLTSQTPF